MIQIPTKQGLPFYTQITNLDGNDYLLEFRFNSREEVWYLQIAGTDGTVLAQGIKLVSNFRLLQKYSDASMPRGELIAFAWGANDSPAGLNELGIGLRVELWYLSQSDFPNGFPDGWRIP